MVAAYDNAAASVEQNDLLETVVGFRILHRWVRSVGLEFLQPEDLAERKNVPVVDISGNWSGKCAG